MEVDGERVREGEGHIDIHVDTTKIWEMGSENTVRICSYGDRK